jgi:hypothetical protein
MIKLNFKKVDTSPNAKMEFYSSINPIPFSLMIGKYHSLPTTIYSRNLSGENFIEFRFDKANHNLYEISLVAIQNDSVINRSLSKEIKVEGFYICNLIENNSLLEDTLPIEIERDKNSICINLLNNKSSKIAYFPISNNSFLGIDDDCYLVSIFINKLSDKNIRDIFGY